MTFIPSTLVFADGEMTGLDERRHDLWEFAAIVRGHRQRELDGEWLWQLRVPDDRMPHADPKALEIGHFHQRYIAHDAEVLLLARPDSAVTLMPTLAHIPVEWTRLHLGAHLVWLLGHDDNPNTPPTSWCGIVPDFDIRFFRAFLESVSPVGKAQMPQHYQPVDVEAMAAGRLCLPPIWNTRQIAAALGVPVIADEMHTALGDARFVERLYDAVMDHGSRYPAILENALDMPEMRTVRGDVAAAVDTDTGWCDRPGHIHELPPASTTAPIIDAEAAAPEADRG